MGISRTGPSLSLDDLIVENDQNQNQALAVKALWRAFISQLKCAMKEADISTDDMARRMNVTNAEFNLLMTSNGNMIPLELLQRAADAVGRNIKLELV